MTTEEILSQYLQNSPRDDHSTLESFPYFTDGENWTTLRNSGWDDWVAGFWCGIHWLAEETDVVSTENAIQLTREIQLLDNKSINTGFRYQYSWIPAYEITGNPQFKQKALQAAQRLTKCYVEDLSLLCNYRSDSQSIHAVNDALMNTPLLYWAVNNSPRGQHYRSLLRNYLSRASEIFIKNSGAVRHRVVYDSESLQLLTVKSPQGVPGGCWSRGLAWTFNGLILGGLFFEDDDLIGTAMKVFDYHQKNTQSIIPAFDYSISAMNQPRLTDTSAAAILASGLLTLGIVNDNDKARTEGEKIIGRLLHSYRRPPDESGVIGGGCFHYPEEDGVNEALIWGDFYTMEAIFMKEYDELPIHLNWLRSSNNIKAQAS